MKSLYLIASLLVFGMCYSQKNDTTYIDLDGKKVNRIQFDALEQSNIRVVIHDFPFKLTKIAFSKRNVGQLDSIQTSQISMYLQKIIGPEYDKSKKTLLHLYKQNSEQISEASKEKKYWSHYKDRKEFQAFLLVSKSSGMVKNEKKHVYSDEYGLIENLFFKKSKYDINHLVIKPSGEIYIFYGTSNLSYILDYSLDGIKN